MKSYFLFIPFLFLSFYARANDTLFYPKVHLKEVVIHSLPENFSTNDFIDIIQKDTTFYKAFKSMHLSTYNGIHDIRIFHKNKEQTIAHYQSETKQIYRNSCRFMHILEEKVEGDFYNKKGDYNYFTAKLYDELFFTKDTVCGENNIVKGSLEKELRGKNRIEKSKLQLKQLLFNPGVAIPGLPGISNKLGIFEEKMADKYDFVIDLVEKQGELCYEFSAIPKDKERNNTVIKYWKTWLRKSDFTILSRDLHLAYKAGIYDFNVKMYVELEEKMGKLVPILINYDGNWHLATQKRERVQFSGKFYY